MTNSGARMTRGIAFESIMTGSRTSATNGTSAAAKPRKIPEREPDRQSNKRSNECGFQMVVDRPLDEQ